MNTAFPGLDRRDFCRLLGVGAGSLSLLGSRIGLAAEADPDRDTVVVIFQRGAMDGLNAVVPYTEANYYARRPTLAVPAPGSTNGALDLDGRFGLHPSLAPLKPLYDSGELALVHAVGLTTPSRSHFDAQDFMERAWLGQGGVFDGWLNRYLATLPSGGTFQAVGMGTAVPRSLSGAAPVVGMAGIDEFGIVTDLQRSGALQSLLQASFNGDTLVASTGQRAFAAVDELKAGAAAGLIADDAAGYPQGAFGQRLRDLAALLKSGMGVQVATVDIGGWDHHNNQAQELPPLLEELAQALVAFRNDLGTLMQKVSVVVMTEFGRRLAENGSRGTDHGRGGVMFLLGGGVQGGQVHADWPGLDQADLDSGDLRVTLDYRQVLAELLAQRNGVSDFSTIFPGWDGQPGATLYRPRG